jgi:hypothetical protein
MFKLTGIVFQYENGTTEIIDDERTCLKFQSRINSSGIMVGMEEFVKKLDADGKVTC